MPIAKIILTGPPWAGKTCLVHRFVHNRFLKERKMTPGMSLKSWKVPMTDDLEFMFYDLGGQPVYATTHRLFLHTRACFLVVWNPNAERNSLDRVYEYVRDLLDVVPDALLTFLTTHADEGAAELSESELDSLRKRYGEQQVKGYFHVGNGDASGIDDLLQHLVTLANSLDSMDSLFLPSYVALREEVQQLRSKEDAPLTITRDEWNGIANGAGVQGWECERALGLFHAFGEVLRLPQGKIREDVVLSPQRFANVLACVMTAEKHRRKYSRKALLRHEEIDQVWEEYSAHLREGFLQFLHESDLAVPLETKNGPLEASLLFPMLSGMCGESNAIFRSLRASYPTILEGLTVNVKFNSLPRLFGQRLQRRLLGITEANSWWREGCVTVLQEDGRVRGFARLGYDRRESELCVENFGPAILLEDILYASRKCLEGFPGVRIEQVEIFDCGTRIFIGDGQTAGVQCSEGVRSQETRDILYRLGLAEGAEETEERKEGEEAKGQLASPADLSPEIKYLWRKMHDDSVTRNDLQRAALFALQELCMLGVKDFQRQKLDALWVLHSSSDSSTVAASPLRPRYAMQWKLERSMSIEIDSVHNSCAAQTSLDEVVKLLLEKLKIRIPNQGQFRGVFWRSPREDVCGVIQESTEDSYGQILDSGFFSGVWVHVDDRTAYQVETVQTSLGGSLGKLHNDIHRDTGELPSLLQDLSVGLEHKQSRYINMVQALLDASENTTRQPPILALVYPADPPALFDATTWFAHELRLTFLCSTTLTPARDDEENVVKFWIRQPSQFFPKAFPYVKLGFVVVQAALESGRLHEYPIPEVSGLYDAFRGQAQAVEAVAKVLEALEHYVKDYADTSFDYVTLLETETFREEEAETLRSYCKVNFALVNAMMDKMDRQWHKRCGLEDCTADDGTSAWVAKEYAQAFREHGRELLRGSVRPEDVRLEKRREPGSEAAEEQTGGEQGRADVISVVQEILDLVRQIQVDHGSSSAVSEQLLARNEELESRLQGIHEAIEDVGGQIATLDQHESEDHEMFLHKLDSIEDTMERLVQERHPMRGNAVDLEEDHEDEQIKMLLMMGELRAKVEEMGDQLQKVDSNLESLNQNQTSYFSQLFSGEYALPCTPLLLPFKVAKLVEEHLTGTKMSWCTYIRRHKLRLATDKFFLFFVCPVSGRIAKTNGGKGYKLSVVKERLRPLLPLLRFAAFLIKMAIVATSVAAGVGGVGMAFSAILPGAQTGNTTFDFASAQAMAATADGAGEAQRFVADCAGPGPEEGKLDSSEDSKGDQTQGSASSAVSSGVAGRHSPAMADVFNNEKNFMMTTKADAGKLTQYLQQSNFIIKKPYVVTQNDYTLLMRLVQEILRQNNTEVVSFGGHARLDELGMVQVTQDGRTVWVHEEEEQSYRSGEKSLCEGLLARQPLNVKKQAESELTPTSTT
eukprot:scaffold1364_cov383-Pinguiococcus_pyrenoidosus.AAC.3